MTVKKPIVIVGTGRNGSSVFQKILAQHPRVAWLSGVSNKFPALPSINRIFMTAIDLPPVGSVLKRAVNPGEAYVFWEYYYRGFTRPSRDLLGQDVAEKTRKTIREVLAKTVTKKRDRLLIKVTGMPRIGFLKEIFPEAKVVHLLRDGRAVAHSLINADWWWQWRGPTNWRLGGLSPSEKEEWAKYDFSPIALAALEWKFLIGLFEKALRLARKEDVLQVKYEELCDDSEEALRRVLDFCELEWGGRFEKFLCKLRIQNKNDKWKRALNNKQKAILQEVLQDDLKKYGYV